MQHRNPLTTSCHFLLRGFLQQQHPVADNLTWEKNVSITDSIRPKKTKKTTILAPKPFIKIFFYCCVPFKINKQNYFLKCQIAELYGE